MLKTIVLFTTAILVLCDSASIITPDDKKCSVKDDECLKSIFENLMQRVTANGIPDIDVPIADPFIIKDMSVQVLGLIDLKLVDATANGLKSCHNTVFRNDIEAGQAQVELLCDLLAVEGNYILESTPALLALSSGIRVHGKGKGSVTVEKLKVNVAVAYEVKKHDDNELHFNLKTEESSYTFEVLGGKVSADNIFVGNQDISTVAVNIANENWKALSKTYGNIVLDKAAEIVYSYAQKILTTVPAKDFVTDDLSSYVK